MGHFTLGLFVPDRIVSSGIKAAVDFVAELMEPLDVEYPAPPYRYYLTPEETRKVAAHHGVPATDLQRLAEAIAGSESLVNENVVDDGDEVIALRVISVGATRTRLYCVTTENRDFEFDWYDMGGRAYGEVTGTQYEGEFPSWHLGLSEEEQVAANMAPVEAVLARVKETGSPIFDAFLTPEGKWYDMPHESFGQPERERSWDLWHLRRFRRGHHVVVLDYHC